MTPGGEIYLGQHCSGNIYSITEYINLQIVFEIYTFEITAKFPKGL